MYYEEFKPEENEATEARLHESPFKKSEPAEKVYVFSWKKSFGMLTRAFFQIAIQLCLLQTFYFGGRSGVNNGIISTIFSSGVIFTAIIFYFLYNQKLTVFDFIGGFFIIGCVALISIGGSGHGSDLSKDLTQEERDLNLILAIVMATVTGLVFALNSLSIQYCTSNGCGVAQANMDGMFLMFLIFFPGFLAIHYGQAVSPYGWWEMILATLILLTQVFGIISLSVGLKNGSAGPV